jgi:TrwC relaxase
MHAGTYPWVGVTAPRAESPLGVVTMSVHKLTAGSGYDYLTRQVAALDATEKGHTGLASYYTERGESPGVWIGSGMDGIEGLAAGDAVTAEQMQALFGRGLHPLAELWRQLLEGPGLTERDYQAVTRLGVPFKILDGGLSPFRLEVAKRIAAINESAGLPADWPVPAADRARVRTEVAREFFTAQHGREPVDARELAGQIAKGSRPRTQTVAGYDLTFSPVKSVSALWAVADPSVAAVIERAHQAAVQDALTFIEEHALFTRTGAQGIRQIDVRGMVATAFTHRDSRAGDPDLQHPRRCREQGPDPRRTLVVDRRAGAVQGKCCRLGNLQHRVGAAPTRVPGRAVCGTAGHRPGQTSGPGDRRC